MIYLGYASFSDVSSFILGNLLMISRPQISSPGFRRWVSVEFSQNIFDVYQMDTVCCIVLGYIWIWIEDIMFRYISSLHHAVYE